MTSFPILDLVLGMIFIYFLLSIISNAIIEMAMQYTRARAEVLEKWLKSVLDENGSELSKLIMNHTAVKVLSKVDKSPSYIGAKNFTTALLDKITKDPNSPNSLVSDLATMEKNIAASKMLPKEMQSMLLLYASEAKTNFAAISVKTKGEIDLFREKIESWYDASMERLTGNLKQDYARKFTWATAIVITLVANADSISLAKYLYDNPTASAKLASQATAIAQNEEMKAKMEALKAQLADTTNQAIEMDTLILVMKENSQLIKESASNLQSSIPLGWNKHEFRHIKGWGWIWFFLSKFFGLTATVLAISMGAPFWFDMINKVANLRNTGAKPEPNK